MSDAETNIPTSHIDLTAEIVSAYVSNNSVPVTELSSLIASVNAALAGLGNAQAVSEEPAVEKPTAAQIRKSISNHGIVSFIDGKTYQSLKAASGRPRA